MSIISWLLRKKEPEVAVVVPRIRKQWGETSNRKMCSGSGAKAMIPTGAGVVDGRQVGMCGVCGRVGRSTKKGIVASHLIPTDA